MAQYLLPGYELIYFSDITDWTSAKLTAKEKKKKKRETNRSIADKTLSYIPDIKLGPIIIKTEKIFWWHVLVCHCCVTRSSLKETFY